MTIDLSTFDPTDANQAMEAKEAILELQGMVNSLEAQLQEKDMERLRWERRMALLEKRLGFAMEIFQGKHDDLVRADVKYK